MIELGICLCALSTAKLMLPLLPSTEESSSCDGSGNDNGNGCHP